MFSKLTSSLNQLASSFKKAVHSIFFTIDDQQTFIASSSPRRPFKTLNPPSYLHFSQEKPRQSERSALEPFLEKNLEITPIKVTINKPPAGNSSDELTFGLAESSQKQAETFSSQTASFKRYDDSSYEALTQQFARISPQANGDQVEKEKKGVRPIQVINFWKKIYKETSQLSSENFQLNFDIMSPIPIKPEKALVEFKYNKRTRSYEAVRQTSILKRKYEDISITESAMSLETNPNKELESVILKKPKLQVAMMEREKKLPLTFQSRGRKKKVESLKSKMKL